MAGTSMLSIGAGALSAAYRQVQTTSHNIANADTEGYSRQRVVQRGAVPQQIGGSWVGRGVEIEAVQRAADAFLAGRASALRASAAADEVVDRLAAQLDRAFPRTDGGLGDAAVQIFNAFDDLAAAPGDLAVRQAVLGRLEDFAALARDSGEQLRALQAQVASEMREGVGEVNALASQIAALNAQIAQTRGAGGEPNDLLDRRDALVSRLSDQIDVRTLDAGDGQLSVFVATGQTLVLGNLAWSMSVQPDPWDGQRLVVGIDGGGGLSVLSDGLVAEGRLGGLMRFQDGALESARRQTDAFVASVAGGLNAQHALGVALDGRAGAALFVLAPPQAIAHAGNARDGAGATIGRIDATVVDPAALRPGDYRVEVDASDPSVWRVTRLSDGVSAVPAVLGPGATVDGLRLDAGSPAPLAGDRFTVRGSPDAAAGLVAAIGDPRALAAANPVVASVRPTNAGTLQVRSLAIDAPLAGPYAPPYAPAGTLRVVFTDDAGGHDIVDGSGATIASGTWTPGTPLRVGGAVLDVAGVPKAGDVVALAAATSLASGNGNALAISALASRPLVAGQTPADAFGALLAGVGVSAQSAASAATHSRQASDDADAALKSVTGVNVDEEVAQLMHHQQAYQAAAKLLQTAQSLIDALMNAVGA